MKRTFSLWLGLTAAACMLALALPPIHAQKDAADKMGKIHGRVINPTGQPQGGGVHRAEAEIVAVGFPCRRTGSVKISMTETVGSLGSYTWQ